MNKIKIKSSNNNILFMLLNELKITDYRITGDGNMHELIINRDLIKIIDAVSNLNLRLLLVNNDYYLLDNLDHSHMDECVGME